jgi:hypothetical protein
MLVAALVIPASANAGDQSNYPESIAGYPVIFVQTTENTSGLDPGNIVLVLLEMTPTLETEPASRQAVAEYLINQPLPKGWSIQVYGGPNATKDGYQKSHQANNDWHTKYGSLLSSSTLRSEPRTFAADLNVDPLYGNNIVTFQSARWTAPAKSDGAGSYFSYLGNNVQTNTGFFLQAGQKYWAAVPPLNVWTDSNYGLAPMPFTGVPYVAGHYYRFAIGYAGPGNPSTWFMSCTDYSGGIYQDVYESFASGNRLLYSENTSIFFENTNRDPAWWDLFDPTTIYVYSADEVLNGQYSSWHEDLRHIHNQWGQDVPNGYPPNEIIGGSLANFGTAHWHLERIPYVH